MMGFSKMEIWQQKFPRQDPRIDFGRHYFAPFSLMNHPIVFVVGEVYIIYDSVN